MDPPRGPYVTEKSSVLRGLSVYIFYLLHCLQMSPLVRGAVPQTAKDCAKLMRVIILNKSVYLILA